MRTALWLVLVALPPSAGLAQQSASPKRVLALHWYDRGYTDDIKLDQELHAALESSAPGRVEYYSEYLDTNQFPGENQALILNDYLRRKYAGMVIDVVIAIANPPLDFLLKNRRELFPHTPIVFTIGAAARARGMPEAGATGIVTANTFRETVDLALKLHPGTKQLFVISGTLNHDKSRESAARTELQVFKDKVVITYLTDLTVEELIQKLKDSPKHSIALYVWQQVLNREGNVLESRDVFSRIALEAVVPLYGMAPSYIGVGMTGGYVWTLEANATKLAQIARRVANGERPQDIPIENAPATPMFDWRQLQRWGIDEDRLPPGSVIRFRELTVWQQYKWRIVGTIAVVALQTVLICALLIQRKQTQRRAIALGEAQRVLQESEERFRRVFEDGPLGLALGGKDYHFEKVNSALCQMVGYSEAELLQRSFVDITHPDDVRADVALATRLFRGEIPSYQVRKRYLKKNGEIIWINLTASVIRDQEGKPLYRLTMIEDITEAKRAQEEALARQKLESVGVLASGIAHDFNNLLGGILASAELSLSELPEYSAAGEELQRIKTASIRGSEIVRELMIYGGIESPALEPVDISALVNEMLQLLKVSISKHTILKIELRQGLPLVKASPAQLRQVVMNLITNASEAIGERSGTIHITSAKLKVDLDSPAPGGANLPEGEYVRLEVSDTGSGMTPDAQARIFDPFFTTKQAGRGLGLAAVQGIIYGHGGIIHVESASGQGSHFEILLPCIDQSARETSDIAVAPSANQLGNVARTVLVVEDEEMLRLAVSKMLRRVGFSVIEAGDGTTGVNLFRAIERKIDVVLLDMTLPGMSGREVLKELLEIRPGVKVILTTAFGEDRALSSIGEQHVWGYVRKPYQFSELTRLLLKASLGEPKMSGNAAC